MQLNTNYKLILPLSIPLLILFSFISSEKLLAINQTKFLTPEPLLINPPEQYTIDTVLFNSLVNSIYKGDSLLISGNFVEAEKTYKGGISSVNDMKIPWYKILLYNRIGFVNYWQTDIDESIKFYYKSLTILADQNVILDSLAYLETIVLFRINSIYNRKYLSYEMIKENVLDSISDRIFKTQGRKLKFHFLNALQADINSDFEVLRTEIKYAERYLAGLPPGNSFWPFLVRLQQGLYYKRLTDYNLAIRYFNELEQKVQREKELEQFKYHVYINLVFLNSQLERYTIAAEYIQKLDSLPHTHQYHPYYCLDYVRIGEVYKKLGMYNEALKSFRIAEDILIQNGIQDENLVYVYYFLAMYYKDVEQNEETTLKYLQSAENIMNQHSAPFLDDYIVYELGNYYYMRKDYDLAIIIFNLVLDDIERLLSDEKYFKNRYPYLTRSPYLTILNYRGAAFYYLSEQKDFELVALEQSYQDYKYLLLLHEKMLREHGYEESKIASLGQVRDDFQNLFEVTYTLFRQTSNNSYLNELFSYSEQSKAYMLKNYISDEQAKRIGGVTERLINKARTYKKEIDSLQYSFSQKSLHSDHSSDELIVNRILQKQEEYDNFIRLLEKQYPEYKLLKNRDNPVSIDKVKEQLKPDQALIEYFIIFNAFFTFYIDKDTVSLLCQSVDKKIHQQILDYRKSFDDLTFNKINRRNIENFINRSYSMYCLALKPVEDLILNKRLIIVPDEELSLIPFETLIQKHPDSLEYTSLQSLPYLILNNPVSYLYSASQLALKHKSRFRRSDYAGFAPAYVNTIYNSVSENRMILEPLPGARDEVLAAKKYFRGRVYFDEEINKSMYFKESQRREIIHLAMHALLDSIEPMNSMFIFSPWVGEDDKQLHAYEVYAQKNASSLVVLSACNTGMGEINRGEGVFSIARAYLLAGVQNVLYTQWSITDRSSAQLMDRFYFYLSRGLPTDVALQKAKIDFILKGDPVKTIPYYWAGYVIMGYPIEIPSRNRIYFIAGLILLVMLAIYITVIRH